jgi:hypothetical protein
MRLGVLDRGRIAIDRDHVVPLVLQHVEQVFADLAEADHDDVHRRSSLT